MNSFFQYHDEPLQPFLYFEGDMPYRINLFQNDEINSMDLFYPLNPLIEMENDSPHEFINPSLTRVSSDSSNSTKLKKKRGKKSNNAEIQHDKLKNDNRMVKIQRSYISFLKDFPNEIMKKLNIKYEFIDIGGKWKGSVNRKFRYSLIKKSIKELLIEAPIGGKYNKEEKLNHNLNVYNKIKEEGHKIILDILEKKYLDFFEKIYFCNVRKFNLSEFGFDSLEIELPQNVKLFNDLLNKNRRNCKDFSNYKVKMEECAVKYFINLNKSSLFYDDLSN